MGNLTVVAAFFAGVVSFVSPCVLPLIPGYLSFISGVSVDELEDITVRRRLLGKVISNSLLFILGFSVVFVVLGASATALGGYFLSHQLFLFRIAGVVVVLFGLVMAGVLRIRFLSGEKRFFFRNKKFGLAGSILVGMAFGFGWTPCIGPVLGSILTLASVQESVGQGVILLSAYSIGLGVPFLAAGIAINAFYTFSKAIRKYFQILEIISGKLLVILGIMMWTGDIRILAGIVSFTPPVIKGLIFSLMALAIEIWFLVQLRKYFSKVSETGEIPNIVILVFFFDIIGYLISRM